MKTWGSLLILFVMLAAGCGGSNSGPARYRLSGMVTFDGKPVPAGTIYFQPLSGPPGSAVIKQGQFDTGAKSGHVGGQHKVMIEGFDGQGTNSSAMGKAIFKPYTVEKELPKGNETLDFNVPASAAEGLVLTEDPA